MSSIQIDAKSLELERLLELDSTLKRNPFQKSRVKKSLKKKFRFMDAGSEAMVANFSYTTQNQIKPSSSLLFCFEVAYTKFPTVYKS